MQDKDFYNSSVASVYYNYAEDTNQSFKEMKEFFFLSKYIKEYNKICEFGCGAGGKIGSFLSLGKNLSLYGIDISKYAIEKATQTFPNISFQVGDISKTPYSDNFFDITCTFFVYEHLQNPLSVFESMYRVTKENGLIFLWFPNYGSPLFPSPPSLFRKNGLQKIIMIFRRLFLNKGDIYTNVQPIEGVDFQPDYDTTAEIHMKYFLDFIVKKYSLKVEYANSKWEQILSGNILFKMYYPFFFLRRTKLFRYLGPQCFLILRK